MNKLYMYLAFPQYNLEVMISDKRKLYFIETNSKRKLFEFVWLTLEASYC